jgi:Outer membrane lipoprotein carrier protein LolA-like
MRPAGVRLFLFWIAACLSLLGAPAIADSVAPNVVPQIVKGGEILRGDFQQDRRLAGFSKPLKSEGTFALLPGKGLIWQTRTPFPNTVVVSPEGLLVLSDGKEAMHMPTAQMPGLGRLYDVLSGAVSGDLKALEKAFAVRRADASDGWQLVLTPLKTNELAASQITSLTVAGRQFVDTIKIDKDGGDVDVVTFANQATTTAPPTADEVALLQAVKK